MTFVYEAGSYLARVVYQYFGESLQGTVKFCLRIQIVKNLDKPSAPCPSLEREINWWITPKTVSWVMRDLFALGYRGNNLSDLDPDTEGFHSFVGRELEVTCSHEEGQDGRIWERWKLCSTFEKLKNKAKLRKLERLLSDPTNKDTGNDPDPSDEEVPF